MVTLAEMTLSRNFYTSSGINARIRVPKTARIRVPLRAVAFLLFTQGRPSQPPPPPPPRGIAWVNEDE